MRHLLIAIFTILLAATACSYNTREKNNNDDKKEEHPKIEIAMPDSADSKRKEIQRLLGEVAALKVALNEQERQQTALWALWTGRIAGGLALVLGVAAFFLYSYPIIGVVARQSALVLGGVSVLAFLAAKLVPYLTIIGIIVACVVLGVIAWGWWRDRTSLKSVVRGVNDLKNNTPHYKDVMRRHVTGKIDKWVDKVRERV